MATMNRSQWNRLADTFETEVCDISREETTNQLASLVRLAAPSGDRSVLVDLGCGLGSFVLKYRQSFSRIVAVEFAPRIIARAKKNCAGLKNVEWLNVDIAKAGRVIGAVADLTVCLNVITSPSPAVRNALWKTVACVTKPNGHALIVVPSLESERMVQLLAGVDDGSKTANAHDGLVLRDDAVQKHFRRSELEPVLVRHGFVPVGIRRVHYPWRKEGLRKPRVAGDRSPWDWACLARRCKDGRRGIARGT